MASVNKVTLIGNCGKDPEIRYMANSKAVANISIATTSKRKDPNTGNTIEDTQWHRVVFYERLAEIVGQYVKKGSPIFVEGRLKYGKYTDKDGIERNTVDIVATEIQLLGSRDGASRGNDSGNGGNGYGDSGGEYRTAPQQRQAQTQPQRQQAPQQPPAQPRPPAPSYQPSGSGFDDMDDDIPF